MARTNATNRTTSTARVADGYRLNRQEHSPSASFNGSSTGITLGFKANSTGFTIATWIKVRRFTAGDRIFDQQDSGPSKGFAVLMPVTASDRSLYFSVFGDSSEEANIKIALNIWEWTHIAISFEPNSAKFYKNGVLAGTDTSVSLGDSVTNLVIGKNASSAANYFNGLMKDFVVYDRVLSLAEVENVRDGIVSQTNLKCHLPLSSDLADISVNGNDGTGTVVFTYTNDSPFNDTVGLNMYAPLTSSLLLERGVGYPTWSRATKAWGFNELGYLEELASGCAFFGGARLVRNLLAATEDSSSGSWVKSTGTTAAQATDSGGGSTAMRFTYGSNQSYLMRQSPTVTSRDAMYCAQFRFKTDATHDWWRLMIFDGGGNQCRVWFNAQTGTIGNTVPSGSGVFVSATLTDVGGGWFALRLVGSPGVAGTGVVYAQFSANDGNGSTSISSAASGDAITIEKPSLVDVTNYDASYVPEYVSVGVEASPYFGAGIDGAKYFGTDQNGLALGRDKLIGFRRELASTNNLLHCRDLTNKAWIATTTVGSELLTNGTFPANITGWTDFNSSVSSWSAGAISTVHNASASGAYATFTTTVGKSYTVSAEIVSSTGYNAYTILRVGNGSTADAGLADSTAFTAPGTKTISFIATGTTSYVYLRNSSSATTVWDNVTAKESSVQPAKTATGLDGIANTATTLTATAADAIILQPISLASAARCASAYVKRRTGTGTISFTQDGTNWTDITAQINSSTWSRVEITSTLANPSVGFKISTSGDAIDVDCVQNEAGAVATSPIVTTSATVTRNADSLTYQTASNWSDTAGTAYIEAQPLSWVAGGAIGSATNGLLLSAANSGATASDGTNTANGPAGSPSGRKKLALRWGAGAMTVASGGVVGTPGTYDGGMGLASVGIAVNSSAYCGPVAIYNYQMTDAELQALTT